ncbi:MAG TPA: hypothetical protein VM165_25670, partial [Planctomycetaceae bacterium]|nr:hypothetical protein [Planctomycetaceae bacterium]
MAIPRRTTVWLLGCCGPLFVAGCQPGSPRQAVAPDNAVAHVVRPSGDSPSQPPGLLPAFRTFGAESGFDFQRYDDIRGLHRILEANGGGVGLFDFDRDGWPDIVMTNGCRLPLNLGDRTSPCELFHNRGAMQFANVTAPSALEQFGYTCGVAGGDC